MLKKLSKIAFIAVILLILLAGLAQSLFFPNDILMYENRYAEKMPTFSLSTFLDGSYQDQVDAALSDQVHLSSLCKEIYNVSHSVLKESLLIPVAQLDPNRYIAFSGMLMFGGTHLAYYPRGLDAAAKNLEAFASCYNSIFASHPDTDFYIYFIEKDTEISFDSSKKTGTYEYLRDRVDLPDQQMDKFSIDDFEQYSNYFYRTDHHWNYAGSYAGYLEVRELLGISEPALLPLETATADSAFSGSKAIASGATTLSEPLIAHRFDFPAMTITVNGAPAADYGGQSAFFAAGANQGDYGYGSFYGGDMGEIIFDTGTTDRGSILVIGESFDNAILKLLASHFDQTYSIDLRYYQAYMGSPFDLNSYLAEHSIDQVLLIGNIDFFVSADFRLEG